MGWPRGTVAVVIALLVATGGALLFGLSPTLHPIDAILGRAPIVVVPDLGGLAQPRAEADLESVGLVSEISTSFSLSAPRGSVISQDPAPGVEVRSGAEVEVVLSAGITRVEMPDAVGKPITEVSAPLEATGVEFSVEETLSEEFAAGFVIEQTPEPGKVVTASDTVRFLVSLGPVPREVPDLLRLSGEGAAYALGVAGLAVGDVSEEASDEEPGVVLESSPPAGETVARDSGVNLIIAAGLAPVVIPDLVGAPQPEAVGSLQAAGLVASVVNAETAPGVVSALDPAAGIEVPAGTVVKIDVSRG